MAVSVLLAVVPTNTAVAAAAVSQLPPAHFARPGPGAPEGSLPGLCHAAGLRRAGYLPCCKHCYWQSCLSQVDIWEQGCRAQQPLKR